MNSANLKDAAIANLQRALSMIRARGWSQGAQAINDGVGPVCLVVALVYTSPDVGDWMARQSSSPVLDEATRRLWVAMGNTDLRGKHFPASLWAGSVRLSLLGWNDDPERTQEEVIHLLEAATAEVL